MRAKDIFGKVVKFDVIFSNVAYVKNEDDIIFTKLFVTDSFDVVLPDIMNTVNGLAQPPASYRKVIFKRVHGTGIIIGQTSKHEGLYNPSENKQASLTRKSTHTFWIVATDINKIVLAEKDTTSLVG